MQPANVEMTCLFPWPAPCACVCVYVCVHACVCVYVCTCAWVHACVYTCDSATRMFECVRACTHRGTRTQICTHTHMHTQTHRHTEAHIHTHAHRHTQCRVLCILLQKYSHSWRRVQPNVSWNCLATARAVGTIFLHPVFRQRLGLVVSSSSRLSLLAGLVGRYGCQRPSLLTFL